MKANRHSFNVILDQSDLKRLIALAEKTASSRGAVVRRLLLGAHNHLLLEQPTCSDGSRCFVPQMHARPPHAKAPTPDL